jgi:hypothetical protein
MYVLTSMLPSTSPALEYSFIRVVYVTYDIVVLQCCYSDGCSVAE